MYEVTVRKKIFASHGLLNYKGAPEPPHDHQWTIEARFASESADASGCAIDFRDVDRAFSEIMNAYQGNTLNELEPFRDVSPSAENFAKHLHGQLAKMFSGRGAKLVSVTAWEDEDHGATYYENHRAQ